MPFHRLAPESRRWLDGGHDIPSIGESRRIATGPRPDVQDGCAGLRQNVQNVDMHLVERG